MGTPLGAVWTFAAAVLLLAPSVAWGQDADGDGVADGVDQLPCDASAAALAWAPAQGSQGLLMFEDLWPEDVTDLDFNDIDVAYHYAYRLDAQGNVSSVRAIYDLLAIGGVLDNGLGLHLPAPRSALAHATRTVDGVTTPLLPSADDGEVTLVVSANLRELYGNAGGPINSAPGEAAHAPARVVVDVVFTAPVAFGPASAPHDVYVFRSAEPSHEIHRPEFAGTARMDGALFGTGADGSTADRRFVDVDGLPYALALPALVAYPREGVAISALYPDIVAFAASGGASATNFYQTQVVAGAAFTLAAAPALPSDEADRSCIPVSRTSCLSILASGQSLGSGTYTIDLDDDGPQPPFDVYCDMTTDGGGFTLVEHLINGYHATTAAVSPAALPGRAAHAKLSDVQIRTLGLSGQNEALIDGSANSNTRFIFRYAPAEWSAFSSTGFTNVSYDAKAANGTWSNNVCNGHYNNRGFSTYSDRHGRACTVVYSGTSRYIATWHTYNYAGGVGGVYDVLIR